MSLLDSKGAFIEERLPSAILDHREVAWRENAGLFLLAWGYKVYISLLMSIVGTIKYRITL